MADPAAPRLLTLRVTGCDDCPFALLNAGDGDLGYWYCGHPRGLFPIVDVGDVDRVDEDSDSITRRLGKPFPDACPVPMTPSQVEPPAPPTRLIDI